MKIELHLATYRVLGLGLFENAFLALLGDLGALKVGVVHLCRDGKSGDVEFGGGGDHLGRDGATHRDAVDLIGTGDESEAGLELLEEDASLATVCSGQQNAHGARREGRSQRSLVLRKGLGARAGEGLANRERWVVLGLTDSDFLGVNRHVL